MRPVNLIPPEERRDGSAPLRSGPVVYVLVGALVLALLGVTALVLTGNQVSDLKTELASVKAEDAAAAARAQRLAAYTQFQTMRERRVETVSKLADSRFDWERVMRELALVLPGNVWLTSLEASADGSSSGEGIAGVNGPSLQISGCASGPEAVAGFVTALKDIDGVTRVGVQSSEVSDQEGGEGEAGGGASAAASGSCSGATFAMTVAFDAAPVASEEAAEASASPAAAAQTAASETESSEGG